MKQLRYKAHRRRKVYSRKTEGEQHVIFRYFNYDLQKMHKTKYKGTLKYGFAVSALDPLYFNLIHQNPQWTMYNRNVSAIRCIFRIHALSAHRAKSKDKLYRDPVSHEISTRQDFFNERQSVLWSCCGCGVDIRVYHHKKAKFSANTVHCDDCQKKVDKLLTDPDYSKEVMTSLFEVKEHITEKLKVVENDIVRYIKRNSKK